MEITGRLFDNENKYLLQKYTHDENSKTQIVYSTAAGFFFIFSLSKPGAYITHNATQPSAVWSQVLVLYTSSG